MDDFTPEQLAVVEKFMDKHYPYLKEIVSLGNKIKYGQSNITIRWHDGQGKDIMRVTNFVRRRIDGGYEKILKEWIDEVKSGQLNVTFQIVDGEVTDMVNAVAYERKQF